MPSHGNADSKKDDPCDDENVVHAGGRGDESAQQRTDERSQLLCREEKPEDSTFSVVRSRLGEDGIDGRVDA